jgi:hypothetical protein
VLHLHPGEHEPRRRGDDNRRHQEHQQISLNLRVDVIEDRRRMRREPSCSRLFVFR